MDHCYVANIKGLAFTRNNDAQRGCQIHVKVGATTALIRPCVDDCRRKSSLGFASTILENCEAETGVDTEEWKREREKQKSGIEKKKRESPPVGIFAPYCAIFVEGSRGKEYDELYRCDPSDTVCTWLFIAEMKILWEYWIEGLFLILFN